MIRIKHIIFLIVIFILLFSLSGCLGNHETCSNCDGTGREVETLFLTECGTCGGDGEVGLFMNDEGTEDALSWILLLVIIIVVVVVIIIEVSKHSQPSQPSQPTQPTQPTQPQYYPQQPESRHYHYYQQPRSDDREYEPKQDDYDKWTPKKEEKEEPIHEKKKDLKRANYCPECGTPTEESKFCRECGEKLIEE